MNIKEEMDRLTEELKVYQDKYYKEGISLVSDNEYDRLTDRLIALEQEHPEFQHQDSPTKRVFLRSRGENRWYLNGSLL